MDRPSGDTFKSRGLPRWSGHARPRWTCAIATPSTDPFSMSALALPMAIMYVVAEFICRRHDAQKAKKLEESGNMLVSIED